MSLFKAMAGFLMPVSNPSSGLKLNPKFRSGAVAETLCRHVTEGVGALVRPEMSRL